jgi:hypothetical protein
MLGAGDSSKQIDHSPWLLRAIVRVDAALHRLQHAHRREFDAADAVAA